MVGQRWLDALFAVIGIPAAELRGPSRVRGLSYWRQLLAALMWDAGMSHTEIGTALGRHRKTTYYMVAQGQRLIDYDYWGAAADAATDLRAAAARAA